MTVLPMFPLGTVLVPSLTIPLHVFEPRYRALVRDCLDGDERFGVVLIERGSEVGGADVRTDVGTVARIIEAVELADGRWAVGAVGTERIRVRAWLPDDPYPQAEVDIWPDPPPGPEAGPLLDRATELLRRALALAAEAGDTAAPATVELTDDPGLASHHLAALAPIGPHDRQRLLAAPSVEARLDGVAEMLEAAIDVLRFRLGGA